jgi:hypothetical protein
MLAMFVVILLLYAAFSRAASRKSQNQEKLGDAV